jgi:hypothetical protein
MASMGTAKSNNAIVLMTMSLSRLSHPLAPGKGVANTLTAGIPPISIQHRCSGSC